MPKEMKRNDEARFILFKANILVDLVKKVFVDLHLDYPGSLEEVKDTKKRGTHGPITRPATTRDFTRR